MSEIVVDARGPVLGVSGRWSKLADPDRYHVTTADWVVRGFLELKEGDRCTDVRRAESERILRGQPFIATAVIRTVPVGADSVRVEVTTVDELSLIASVSVMSKEPFVRQVAFGDANVLGSALRMTGQWRHDAFRRDGYALQIVDYLLLGKPYQVSLDGVRRSLGSAWLASAAHPFLSDLQRFAWRATVGRDRYYFPFLHPSIDGLALFEERRFTDVGGIVRIGEPGRLSLFGASVTSQKQIVAQSPVIVRDSGVYADTSSALMGRYPGHRTARVNALWGVRNVKFMPVSGYDALRATQDVRKGFQLGLIGGRSLNVLGSTANDLFLSADLYAGVGTRKAFLGLQAIVEGRQDYDRNRWDGILGSGRIATYIHPHSRQTIIASGEYAAGWRQRAPFQLRLGDFEGGVRGLGGAEAVGGSRAIVRLEDRWYVRSIGKTADVGVAFFGDAGRLWAGNVPFGTNRSLEIGAGVSVLVALPVGSKRLWRLDVAFPVTREPGAGLTLRLTSADFTRLFWREPREVTRSRESYIPTSLFNWP